MKKLTVNRKRKQLETGTFYKHVGRKASFPCSSINFVKQKTRPSSLGIGREEEMKRGVDALKTAFWENRRRTD